MSDKKKTEEKIEAKAPDLGSLEEDDEFEEFPAEEWGEMEKEPEVFWEENWDDDNIEDDFSKQLRAVLEKSGQMKA